MPAQSGSDPVSAALQLSLAPVKYRSKINDLTSFKSSTCEIAVDSRNITTASAILSANIQYTLEDDCYSPSNLYNKLKEKYTVLSTTSNNDSVTSQEMSSSQTANCSSSSSSSSPCSSSLSNKKAQQQLVSSNVPHVSSKSTNSPSLPLPKKILYPPNLVCLGWKGSVPVGAGFVNLGNTCYLNSALQALLHVPAFVNWLQSDTIHISKCESMNGVTHSECLICAMVKILHNTHKFTGTSIKPMHIYSKLKDICKHLVHGHQEDAHEFLRYLIEGMERSYLTIFNGMRLDSYSKETTPLNQIFGGYMRTEVTCLECGHISTTFQHFQDLLLDIRQANSVEEALETYFSRERLGDGDQAYKCGQCKRRAAATKKFSLERPPNALCIQLKRFNVMGGKNNKHISVKQVLDMTRYIHQSHPPDRSLKYKLVSMVSHLGQSANCGHYTAIGQSAAGSYYHFDDSIVRPVSLQNVLNTNAYIIMYELDESSREWSEDHLSSRSSNVNTATVETSQPNTSSKKAEDEKLHFPNHFPLSQEKSVKITAENSNSFTNKVNKNGVNSNSVGQTSEKTSNLECRLVPYLSESSESESGCESQTTTNNTTTAGLSSFKTGKCDSRGKQRGEDKVDQENCSTKSESGELKTVKEGVGESAVGWQVTSFKNENKQETSCTSSSSGKWSIVRTQDGESPKKECDNEKKHTPSSSRELGTKFDSYKNPSHNPSTLNACTSSTDTLQTLRDMSHQGYGSLNIQSWNGNKSNVNREIEKDKVQNKRPFMNYNEELDRGKVKKKRYHKSGMDRDGGNGSWNRMQEFHNRKGCWNSPLNGSARQNFYRQYTYEKSKNHNRHHPYYRGIGGGGGYYRNSNNGNGGGGHNFPLSMMSPSLYKKPHCT